MMSYGGEAADIADVDTRSMASMVLAASPSTSVLSAGVSNTVKSDQVAPVAAKNVVLAYQA
eukprot:703763-Pleurochrysis_carterae.AAC.5